MLASCDAVEPGLVNESVRLMNDLTDVTLVSEDTYLPNEDFTDETLAIDDTFGDDVRGGAHGG